jgi:hypothetical protein
LGLNRATLYFRMKKLGIVRPGTESDLSAVKSGTGRFGHSEYFGGEMP